MLGVCAVGWLGWSGRRAGVSVLRLFILAARGRDTCVELWCQKQKGKKIWHPKFTVSFARGAAAEDYRGKII